MKKVKQIIVLALLMSCLFGSGKAQYPSDSLSVYYVLMKDNNIFYGNIMEQTKRTILLETESVGLIRMQKRKVRYIERFRPELMIDSVYWPKYKFPHHNTFTPTGEIGESYYQNTLLYWNTFNYKLGDKASLGGGFLALVNNQFEGFSFWLSPKFKIPLKSKKIKMSIGYFGLLKPGSEAELREDRRLGIVYGAISNGNEVYRISAGLGGGIGGGKFFKWPFYSMSGMLRFKNRSFVRVEIMGGGSFGSYSEISFRTMQRKGTLDVGWVFPANKERIRTGQLLGGPYFSLLYTKKEY